MKKLLALTILLSAALAQAQTITNIDVRATTTVIVTGVSTNTSNTTLNITGNGNNKDIARVNGLSDAYLKARAGGFTNTFDNWIAKTWAKDAADVTTNAYLQSISQDTLNKLTILVFNGGLSPADLSTITTIAQKAPLP